MNGNYDSQDDHGKPARQHQIEQISQYCEAKNSLKNNQALRASIVAATGTGKSYTMQRISEIEKGRKTLILTSRNNLVADLSTSYQKDFPSLKVASSDDSKANVEIFLTQAINDKSIDVVITTLQGFQLLFNKKGGELKFLEKVGLVMFDEAHNLFSEERFKIVQKLKTYADMDILFFTATPTRMKAHKDTGLTSVYELSGEEEAKPKINPFSLKPAIDRKVLAPFQIVYVNGLKLVLKISSEGEFNVEDANNKLAQSLETHLAVQDVYTNTEFTKPNSNQIHKVFGKYAMAFCSGIEHAEELSKYLNGTGTKVEEHEQKYRSNVDRIFEEESSEFLAIRKEVPGVIKNEFLKKYPYTFADAVHSGNKNFKKDDSDMKLRLIRNKLGGSTILCGADKLTEGFDNPAIEVGFMIHPIRYSNIKSEQRFGRETRICPELPEKLAIAFEFVFSDKQLLLSEIQGNIMHYGNPDQVPLTMSVPQHIENAPSYTLNTNINFVGILQRKDRNLVDRKRKRSLAPVEEIEEAPVQKKKKTSNSEDEKLMKEFRHVMKQLKEVEKQLSKFEIRDEIEEVLEEGEIAHEEVMELVDSDENTKKARSFSELGNAVEDIDLDSYEMDHTIFMDAQESIAQLKESLTTTVTRTKKSHALEKESGDSETEGNLNLNKIESNREFIQGLIKSASKQIEAARKFMTRVQMEAFSKHAPVQEHATEGTGAITMDLCHNLDQEAEHSVPTVQQTLSQVPEQSATQHISTEDIQLLNKYLANNDLVGLASMLDKDPSLLRESFASNDKNTDRFTLLDYALYTHNLDLALLLLGSQGSNSHHLRLQPLQVQVGRPLMIVIHLKDGPPCWVRPSPAMYNLVLWATKHFFDKNDRIKWLSFVLNLAAQSKNAGLLVPRFLKQNVMQNGFQESPEEIATRLGRADLIPLFSNQVPTVQQQP